MSTTSVGRQAEDIVAKYLAKKRYKILSQNWRTRYCEIDIVACKKKMVYFVEVKYRQTSQWGGGLEAITPRKLKQMSFAAEMWVTDNNWRGDYQLMAVEVSGDPPTINQLLLI